LTLKKKKLALEILITRLILSTKILNGNEAKITHNGFEIWSPTFLHRISHNPSYKLKINNPL
jgi:hypothetical protein